MVPSTTFPKLTLPGVTESWGCTPVPLRAMLVGELGASLVSVTLPLVVPAACGAKVTVKAIDVPAGRLTGKVSPLRLNPVPVTAACEMVKVAVPALEAVTICEALLPTPIFPKLNAAGLKEIWGEGATPAPESAIVVGELTASLKKVTLPVMLPAALGVKNTVKPAEAPGDKVNGRLNPLMLNAAPEMLAC